MLEKHEKQLLSHIDNLLTTVSSQSEISAYPALAGMFWSIRRELDAICSTLLDNRRREIVHGLDQTSVLYKMLSGKTVAIPDNIVHSYDPTKATGMSPYRSITEIVQYAKKWHGHTPHSHVHGAVDVSSVYDMSDNSVIVKFRGSDAALKFENPDSTVALYHSPLLSEPLTISMERSWIDETFHNDIVEALCGKEGLVKNADEVLGEHWYTAGEDSQPKVLPESVERLTDLLSRYMYGEAMRSTCSYYLNGYEITLEAVGRLAIKSVKNVETRSEIHRWYRNPLLVTDIRKTIESKVEELLNIHDLEMTGDCPRD